ncbi:hypothetical protein CsSME_00035925 [Camellia sinensis var. sinensis]
MIFIKSYLSLLFCWSLKHYVHYLKVYLLAVEVTNIVNSWAEKETNGLIKEVLPSGSVGSSTRLIFANALYFKGAWNEKFEASKTKDHDFYLLNGTSVQVPFMTISKSWEFLTNKVKISAVLPCTSFSQMQKMDCQL